MITHEVEQGAQFLDETVGLDWIEKVNLDTLDLWSGCSCVAAQVVDGYEGNWSNAWEYAMCEWGVVRKGEDSDVEIDTERSRRLGFLVDDDLENYDQLDDGWREVIAERIAERTPVPS